MVQFVMALHSADGLIQLAKRYKLPWYLGAVGSWAASQSQIRVYVPNPATITAPGYHSSIV
jgi:hypothetical protein